MAVDLDERRRLLPSENHNILSVKQSHKGSSTSESISTGFGSTGSSWSDFSSPLGSELCSTETGESDDDDEFMAQLTRQMADYMLDEENNGHAATNCSSDNPPEYSCTLPPSPHAYQSFPDDQTGPVHLYKLEDQPAASTENQGYASCWGRRVHRTELTQQQVQHIKPKNRGSRRGDALSAGGSGSPVTSSPALHHRRPQPNQRGGSGMRAVFLGGPGSVSGSFGTGVFLPRGPGNQSEARKKPGCSTVLIPARVLQTLQMHFQDMHARSQSPTSHPHDIARMPNLNEETKNHSGLNNEEMGLPQEWTY